MVLYVSPNMNMHLSYFYLISNQTEAIVINTYYSTSQKNFAVGRPSPADRSEKLIAACRLRPVTAGSGRLR